MNKRIISTNVQLGESFKIPVVDTADEDIIFANPQERERYQQIKTLKKQAEDKANALVNVARQQADQVINDATVQARRILEESIIKSNNAIEEARQQGYSAGFEQGTQKASEEIYSKIANLEAIAESTFDIKKEIIISAEQEILQLSIAVAQRILKQQLEIKPEMIKEIIKAAVAEIKDKEEIRIIINPQLKDQLYNFSDELKTLVKGMKTVKIVEDKTINPDSAIIESPESRIDARLEAQIAEITREIMKTYSEDPESAKIIDKKKK